MPPKHATYRKTFGAFSKIRDLLRKEVGDRVSSIHEEQIINALEVVMEENPDENDTRILEKLTVAEVLKKL
jgi:hypothetical protein